VTRDDWRSGESIELTEEQFVRAAELAYRRDASFRSPGGPDSNLLMHMRGVMGELAAAQSFDTNIDSTIYQGGDQGWDIIYRGIKYDVKTTAHDPPNLMVSPHQLGRADAYLSVHIESNIATLVGSATSADVKQLGHKCAGCFRVKVAQLDPWPVRG